MTRLLLGRVMMLVLIGATGGAVTAAMLSMAAASFIPQFPGITSWSLVGAVLLIGVSVLPAVMIPIRSMIQSGAFTLLRES